MTACPQLCDRLQGEAKIFILKNRTSEGGGAGVLWWQAALFWGEATQRANLSFKGIKRLCVAWSVGDTSHTPTLLIPLE